MAIREHSIYDCILRNALNLSGETALVSGDLRLTFSEIPIHVNCLARGLLNTGFEKGDRIAVLLNNCAEYALLLAACARVGVVAVCWNTRTSAGEMRMVLESTKPKALLFQTSFEQQAEELRDLFPHRQFTVLMKLRYFLHPLTNCWMKTLHRSLSRNPMWTMAG